MSADEWTDLENDACVARYFAMLGQELANEAYNKAAQNRLLQEQTGRSRGSIEFKLCNISAAIQLPDDAGYGRVTLAGQTPRVGAFVDETPIQRYG